MPEKYISSHILAISGWLTKMERYFRLIKYPTDIWVDVIATRITDAAQAWLDKELQDLQLGQRPCEGRRGYYLATQTAAATSELLAVFAELIQTLYAKLAAARTTVPTRIHPR